MSQKIQGGYYIKARCIKKSAIAHSPPYVREIWDYLLREANHKDSKYSGFLLKRGQLFRTYREIRDDLKWKVGYRTERFNENQMKMGMRYLMKQLMITVTKQPRGNIITILNYNYFQNPKNYETTNETTNVTTNGQPMGNQLLPSINKNDKNKEKKERKEIFTPPNLKEVETYCQKRKNNINPQIFVDWNTSKGWMIGKNKMKDWKAAIRTWEQRDRNENPQNSQGERVIVNLPTTCRKCKKPFGKSLPTNGLCDDCYIPGHYGE